MISLAKVVAFFQNIIITVRISKEIVQWRSVIKLAVDPMGEHDLEEAFLTDSRKRTIDIANISEQEPNSQEKVSVTKLTLTSGKDFYISGSPDENNATDASGNTFEIAEVIRIFGAQMFDNEKLLDCKDKPNMVLSCRSGALAIWQTAKNAKSVWCYEEDEKFQLALDANIAAFANLNKFTKKDIRESVPEEMRNIGRCHIEINPNSLATLELLIEKGVTFDEITLLNNISDDEIVELGNICAANKFISKEYSSIIAIYPNK